jgi:EAL domain-containing protein (putative c-di-GMP-specific phosphodiesterase class I)
LWLNEGAFGPDEHGVVLDALDVFALDPGREDLQLKLDDDRSALVACSRDATKELLGIAIAIVETPASEEFAAKLSAPRLIVLLRRLGALLAPTPSASDIAAAAAQSRPAAKTLPPPEEFTIGDAMPRSESRTPSEAPARDEPPARNGTAARTESPVRAERRTHSSGSEKPSVRSDTIHARRYARLRTGGAARRYEVKLAPNASFAADLALTKHVIEHLQRSGDRYRQTPSSFTVPLSVESVTEKGWLTQLQPILARAGLPDGLIGFSLPPAAWQKKYEATERFIAQCKETHCFVALDDFSLGNTGLALLRSSSVKCLKIDAELIGAVAHDKFAHATLAAIVQAARVLGLYCVAKKVSSASEAKWLAAAGIEFADGVSRGVAVAATRTGEVLSLRAAD